MTMPAADAMTKPASMPTSNVPSEPAMSRLIPTIGSLRALIRSFARAERAGSKKQEPTKFGRPKVEALVFRARTEGRRVRQERGPLEPRRPLVRGRGSSLRLAHGFKTIAHVVKPEHRRAQGRPGRSRRERIEHFA